MDDEIARLVSLDYRVVAVGRDSRAALKRLYELEQRRLFGIALRIVHRPEIAADALQDAFVQVWQHAASFSPERGNAAAWLTGIVRFRALDAVRKLGREVLSDDPALGDRTVALFVEPDGFPNGEPLARLLERRLVAEFFCSSKKGMTR